MLQVIFSILLLFFLFRVIRLAVRAAWGLMKVLVFVVLFPGILLVLAGQAAIRLPGAALSGGRGDSWFRPASLTGGTVTLAGDGALAVWAYC